MASTTMVDGSGRMVIPKEIRKEMRIAQGTFLLVEKESEHTIRIKIVRTTEGIDTSSLTPDAKIMKNEQKWGVGERLGLKEFLQS